MLAEHFDDCKDHAEGTHEYVYKNGVENCTFHGGDCVMFPDNHGAFCSGQSHPPDLGDGNYFNTPLGTIGHETSVLGSTCDYYSGGENSYGYCY